MANYNTFVVVDCKARKIVMVTSSARRANFLLTKGIRVEVWNNNKIVEKIYEHDKIREKHPLGPYIQLERDYIRNKQANAERRNSKARLKMGAPNIRES